MAKAKKTTKAKKATKAKVAAKSKTKSVIKAAPKKKIVKKLNKKTAKKVAKKTAAKKDAKRVAKSAVRKPAKALASKSVKLASKQSHKQTVTPALKAMQSFVTPLDDRILVQVGEAERMTAGGLYIPDTVTDVSGQIRGQVVAVGRGRLDRKGKIHPMDVKLGDQVVLNEHSGSKIRIENKDFVFVRESEVLGIQTK